MVCLIDKHATSGALLEAVGGGGRGGSPLHFFVNRKKCPDFGKKWPVFYAFSMQLMQF